MILDRLDELLGLPNTFVGILPAKPDNLTALFEYQGTPPAHSFGITDYSHNVQVRIRDKDPDSAYDRAIQVQNALKGYSDGSISIRQISNVIPIGMDDASPPRHECTVNFLVVEK